jgi:hypothetical protein
MEMTRRVFLKRVGIALASLAATRCTLVGGKALTPRDRVRDCWLRFDWLAEETRDWDREQRGQKARDKLAGDHRAALNELVAADELDATVAEHVQVAFDAAVQHVWQANAPITCYKETLINYRPVSSDQLTQQAAILAELADDADLDAQTVAQAQSAIERDITFLNLSSDEVQDLYREVEKLVSAGSVPRFDEVDLQVTPEAVQAAQFLVALLLEEQR